jgi:hypothetical protein
MLNTARSLSKITFYLLIAVIAELAIGGGGRIFAIGPVSLRMVLFAAAMVVTAIHLLRGEKIPDDYRNLLFAFVFLMAGGLINGIIHGSEKQFWWEDVKPLLYFLILPFFLFAIQGVSQIRAVAQIIKICSIVLAGIFFLALVAIHSGWIRFNDFYKAAIATTEFFFRGEITFFYKGFLYLCIGFIFVDFTQRKNKILLLILLTVAILLTLTRGFLFALALTYAAFSLLNRKWWLATTCVLLAALILFSGKDMIAYASKGLYSFQHAEKNTSVSQDKSEQSRPDSNDAVSANAQDATLLGDREYSDSTRMGQIKQVRDSITFTSFLVGHGLGMGIPIRPVHMEISYLEIFHKQGILGLTFWTVILFSLFKKYRATSGSPAANAFFFSALFVFFESLTNQFINNPIGLSMLLLAMVALDRLQKLDTKMPAAV